MFWISKDSVLEFGGATYRYGDKLPDGVSESFVEKGKASRTAPSAPATAPGEVELLKAQVATLRDELAAANQTIEQLTATALTPAAGPRKEGKK